jgi:DNA-binding PadR family transcriptional regulator
MSLGQQITYNTMQAYELIKDIKDSDNEWWKGKLVRCL